MSTMLKVAKPGSHGGPPYLLVEKLEIGCALILCVARLALVVLLRVPPVVLVPVVLLFIGIVC